MTARLGHRARYHDGVAWIAYNDESGSGDSADVVAGYVSTLLLADLFGADPGAVALDVIRERKRAGFPLDGGAA